MTGSVATRRGVRRRVGREPDARVRYSVSAVR